MVGTGKLIVLGAFDKSEEGDLVPAFEPRQIDTEERAVCEAKLIAAVYPSVVAWSRDADPSVGDCGAATVLFHSGNIPNLERIALRTAQERLSDATAYRIS